MLTDIFAYRYQERPIWTAFTEVEQRLLNQGFKIVKDVLPYYAADGSVRPGAKEKWRLLHDQLARELGINELSQTYYSYVTKWQGNDHQNTGTLSFDHVCQQFVIATPAQGVDADRFIKERLSFVELGLRYRAHEVAIENADLPNKLQATAMRAAAGRGGIRISGDPTAWVQQSNDSLNAAFQQSLDELNERFRRARAPLSYHNGFIQIVTDEVIEEQIAKPFWQLVEDPRWKNVDIDMKEALDQRDSGSKDPAIFAAKALESAVKVVSDLNGWTRGTENGAAQYIDNLMKVDNGFLTVWEGEMLKDYFRKVRNSVGHGPGTEPMPTLTPVQTDWAIETAMTWARTMIRRLNG